MTDVIIIVFIVTAAAAGIVYTVRHFKGRGGCCGGGYRPRRKKLKHILYTKTFRVEGMHCEHCQSRVEEAVGDVKALAGRVDLKKGELTVSYAEEVEDAVIVSRVERLGYRVTPMQH